MHCLPSSTPLQVPICSDCSDSKDVVLQLARRLGFSPVDKGGLCASRDVEEAPLVLFNSWGSSIMATFLFFLFFYGYNFLKHILLPYLDKGENNFYQLPLVTVNETLPAVSLVTLALVYLPGIEKSMKLEGYWTTLSNSYLNYNLKVQYLHKLLKH